MILFFAGAWVGKHFRRVREGKYTTDRFSNSLAKTFVKRSGDETNDSFDRRVKQSSAAISAAAPILTFIGTLIGALSPISAQLQRALRATKGTEAKVHSA